MKKKTVGLKEIAYELNVSINTVSRALRDMDDISKELKAKVRKKAIELGYIPNQVSQLIKKDGKKLVAILINSFNNLYFSMLSGCIIENFDEHDQYDYTLLFSNNENLTEDVIKQCLSQRVDLIVSHLEPSEEALDLAKLNSIHIVLIGTFQSKLNVDIVSVDEEMGSVLAARYFYGFHNVSRVIYVGKDYPLSELRYILFSKELNKICSNSELVYINYKNNYHEIYSHIVGGYRGIYFFNDELAYEVLSDLNKICYNIRKLYPDLHIVGFDCLREKIVGLTQLTSIKTDFNGLANKTYDVISNRLEYPQSQPKFCIIPVKLKQREVDKE